MSEIKCLGMSPFKSINDINNLRTYFLDTNLRNYYIFNIAISTPLGLKDVLQIRNNSPIVKDKEFAHLFEKLIDPQFPDSNHFIFKSSHGSTLNARSYLYILKKALATCNIQGNYGTDSLKKTYYYHQFINGRDIKPIREEMGYTGRAKVIRLLHLTNEDFIIHYQSKQKGAD